jgi:hypothetical protein
MIQCQSSHATSGETSLPKTASKGSACLASGTIIGDLLWSCSVQSVLNQTFWLHFAERNRGLLNSLYNSLDSHWCTPSCHVMLCRAVSGRVVPSWPSDPGQKARAAPPIEAPRWLALDVRRSSLRLPRSSWSSRSSWSCWSCIDTEICWSYKVTSVIFSRIQDGPFAEPTSD